MNEVIDSNLISNDYDPSKVSWKIAGVDRGSEEDSTNIRLTVTYDGNVIDALFDNVIGKIPQDVKPDADDMLPMMMHYTLTMKWSSDSMTEGLAHAACRYSLDRLIEKHIDAAAEKAKAIELQGKNEH